MLRPQEWPDSRRLPTGLDRTLLCLKKKQRRQSKSRHDKESLITASHTTTRIQIYLKNEWLRCSKRHTSLACSEELSITRNSPQPMKMQMYHGVIITPRFLEATNNAFTKITLKNLMSSIIFNRDKPNKPTHEETPCSNASAELNTCA